MGFGGELLRLPRGVEAVVEFHTRQPLARGANTGAFVLPAAKGRLLLEVPGYFRGTAGGQPQAVMPASQWR